MEDIPLGPLINDQAELRTLESSFYGSHLRICVYLADCTGLSAQYSGLADFRVFLAPAAADLRSPGSDNRNVDKPATLPALVMAQLFGVSLALLLVAQKWQPQIIALTTLLPASAIVAIVLPSRLLHVQEFEAFASALIMLLVGATIFNLTVVPQICAWADACGPQARD